MAIASKYGECKHCGEEIALRTYANGTEYGVKLWVTGNGTFPGDQQICSSNKLYDSVECFCGYGNHEVA